MSSQGDGTTQGQAPGDEPALVKKYAWPEKPVLLGTKVKRLDGPDKASGRAKYAADISRPGMLYARIVRSPHPHARVVGIDRSEADRSPGVKASLDHKQAGAEVMYHGDVVAGVAADTEDRAIDAARLVRVQYQILSHVATVERAMEPDAPVVFPNGNTRENAPEESGDLTAGHVQSAFTVQATYSTQVVTHLCMESHSVVCEWEGDRLTAWISTQAVHAAAQQFAQGLGIAQANVRVIAQHVGGSFGSKAQIGAEGLICARLAQSARAPVKLTLDRKEEHLDTGSRPSATAEIMAGVSADGILTVFDAKSWGTGGAGAGSDFPLPYIYQFRNRKRTHTDVYTNTGPQRPMRASGHPQGSFVTEVLMDELADKVRMDPVEFRLKNLPPDAPDARWRTDLPEAATLFGWDRRHGTGDPAPGPIKSGIGCALNHWDGGGRGTQARCEIMPDGTVVVKCGTQDTGGGTRTLVAIVAAETLGVSLNAVRPEIGDTQHPFSDGSGGGTTAASVSPAVRLASARALERLFAVVAPALKVDAGTLEAAGSRIQVKGDTSKGMSWSDACTLLRSGPASGDAQWEPGLSGAGTSGVQFAEVKVDVETGIVRVERVLAMQGCGLVINALAAESQVQSGIVGSLSFALSEDRVLDRITGHVVNPNMEWYLVAGISEAPKIEVHLKSQPERGVIGISAPAAISTAAAIANAVRNAVGVTIRSLPLTPQKVLNALAEGHAGGTTP